MERDFFKPILLEAIEMEGLVNISELARFLGNVVVTWSQANVNDV